MTLLSTMSTTAPTDVRSIVPDWDDHDYSLVTDEKDSPEKPPFLCEYTIWFDEPITCGYSTKHGWVFSGPCQGEMTGEYDLCDLPDCPEKDDPTTSCSCNDELYFQPVDFQVAMTDFLGGDANAASHITCEGLDKLREKKLTHIVPAKLPMLIGLGVL